ncbi:hypothetical protein CEXT_584841 [Caerostris extrusa]|uniref:Uncharacterized protein n=1 Tax=Caerostris extrusa TaxID=172846 RepID=A0AAV4T1H1_CAEEX|nr:hypothetical protein CEXT_584841 [Caerostris extrusa]
MKKISISSALNLVVFRGGNANAEVKNDGRCHALPSGQHVRCPNCPALLLSARDPKDAVRKLHAPCNYNCNCSERGQKTARRLMKTECM